VVASLCMRICISVKSDSVSVCRVYRIYVPLGVHMDIFLPWGWEFGVSAYTPTLPRPPITHPSPMSCCVLLTFALLEAGPALDAPPVTGTVYTVVVTTAPGPNPGLATAAPTSVDGTIVWLSRDMVCSKGYPGVGGTYPTTQNAVGVHGQCG
jgi:hypothetical protein